MIPVYRDPLPYLTSDQMREVDRLMIEVYHIELIQMMENAGRNLAHLARIRFFNGMPHGKHITVLAGTGGNGGGALVCARWLHNAGAVVTVYLTTVPSGLASVPAHQLDILQQMRIPVQQVESIDDGPAPDLIIDGIIGYSLDGPPRDAAAKLITWANAGGSPVLALDVPSGLDASTGTVFDPVVHAKATMTLALPKDGLRSLLARPLVGELYLANIGVPPQLYSEPSLRLTIGAVFSHDDIVRLW
jgi:NAD(P)H-hydrate epimerase